MSPRRRLLLALLASVVILAVVVAGLLVARAQRTADTVTAVPQDRPGPVLLVPGYGGSTVALEALASRLQAAGRDARVLTLDGDGTGDLRRQADLLGQAADAVLATGAPSVDIVGFSAGGVTARLWAAERGGARQARRIVTLGAPHHGTDVAALAAGFLSGSCPEACRQLVPDSDLLSALNRVDETPEGPRWVTIWTEQDDLVTPPESAQLQGAIDISIQGLCPGRRVTHGELPTDPVVTALVLRALDVAEPAPPRPGDCAAFRT